MNCGIRIQLLGPIDCLSLGRHHCASPVRVGFPNGVVALWPAFYKEVVAVFFVAHINSFNEFSCGKRNRRIHVERMAKHMDDDIMKILYLVLCCNICTVYGVFCLNDAGLCEFKKHAIKMVVPMVHA